MIKLILLLKISLEEKNNNRTLLFMFLISIGILLLTLLGVGVVLLNLVNPSSAFQQLIPVENQTVENKNPNYVALQVIQHLEPVDYNFKIAANSPSEGVKDDFSQNELKFEFPNLFNYQSNNLSKITIPSLGIDAPIILGSDGDTAIDQGFWLYPGSYIIKGEKIFFCHRRYWGRNHPYSCWYLDKIQPGQDISLITKNNETLTYKVVSVIQIPAEDNNYLKASADDYLKIITCAPLGKSTHRLVVIAKLVS